MAIDLSGGWSVLTDGKVPGFGIAGPATLPTTVAQADPMALDYVVRFITQQGSTLTLDGAQFFGLHGFSFGATQTLDIGSPGPGGAVGKVAFNALSLSLDDAALNPTLFQMLAAGTQFKEVDVLGYQPTGAQDLLVQDSFQQLAGGTLSIDQSGLATYVAQYGTVTLRHSTMNAAGSLVTDPSGQWNFLTNNGVSSGVIAGPATLPTPVAQADPTALDYVVRFITQQGSTLTLDGAQFFGLHGFSFGATQSLSFGTSGLTAGRAAFNGLSLSLGDAALNPTLFQMLAAGTQFKEVDVLGYQPTGAQNLLVQDSFQLLTGGTLSIDQSGLATYVAQYGTVTLQHSTMNAAGSLVTDPSGKWSVVTNTGVSSGVTAGPANLPTTVASADPTALDYVVRFITQQGSTLTLDGAQFFGLHGFSFGDTQTLDIGTVGTGSRAAFNGLSLSLGDAALNPTLFQMLAAGTQFKEVDVLGYQPTGAQDLLVQDSFQQLAGGTLSIDQSGLATYVAQYGTVTLQHSTMNAAGSLVTDPSGKWNLLTNAGVSSGVTAGPANLPTTVASADPTALDYVVRFITQQGSTLTLDGAQFFGLHGFSFGATQTLSFGTSGLAAGRAAFNGLSLSLGDAALNPTLFQMLAADMPFKEVDVLGYQPTGAQNLLVQDSFQLLTGGTLSIDQSGLATYVAQYETVTLQHSTMNAAGSLVTDPSGQWSVVTNTGVSSGVTAGPANLPTTVASADPTALDYVVRFITQQGSTLTLDGAQFFGLHGFSFGDMQTLDIGTVGTGSRAAFNGLSLSLGDAALNPTLFQMLAAGTKFKEVDVLGYQPTGAKDLLVQDSFQQLVGGTLSIDQSGLTTYVAQYGTVTLQHSTMNAAGSLVTDPSGKWNLLTNSGVSSGVTAGPANLPTTVVSADPTTLNYVVRFITDQGSTLTLDGAQFFGLHGFSFGATQSLSIGTSGLAAGRVAFNALSLSLGDAALNPTLFQMLAAGTQFNEVDVLGYQPTGAKDLLVQDSFQRLGGETLSIDQSGLATYVAQYGLLLLGVDSAALQAAACFAAGTRIATVHGEVAVEALRAGDQVLLAQEGTAPVIWLGHRTVDCARHPRPHDVLPVRVRAHAFGPGRPHSDLLLSPDHAVFADGHLIPVRYLINGATVAQEAAKDITYWHVELPTHGVLLAEGLPAESYLDTGNRSAFANGGSVAALTPDFARAVWAEAGCAPLVIEGAVVEAVRSYLVEQAENLGWQETAMPGLALEVDGRPCALRRAGDTWVARLPPGARRGLLRSRIGVPAEHDLGTDRRRLGVAVATLALDGQPVGLDDARLGDGWFKPEGDWRWTGGSAGVALDGSVALTLRLGPAIRYWLAPPHHAGERRAA